MTNPSPETVALLKEIGRYRILERLGAGGMGTVYKAHDQQLDRIVALKLPHFHGPSEEVARRVQRFQREARAAAQVWHPHVCPIFDVGDHHGQPFVVLAYVAGQSLAERLAAQGRYDNVAEAVALIRQVLDALEAVHAHGIVHRDLKPGNILLDPTGKAILTDFGLARPDNDAEQLTSEGVIVGTPSYMAPEQAAGQSNRIGPCTDLYSAGVVLYQMLTGRLPFEGPALTVLSKIVHEAPPPPSTFRSDLTSDLEAVLLKALAKESTERFQSARALADVLAIGNFASSTPAGFAMVTPVAAAPGPTQALNFPASIDPGLPLTEPDRDLWPAAIWLVIGGLVLSYFVADVMANVRNMAPLTAFLLPFFGLMVGAIVLSIGILSLGARKKQNRLNALLRAAETGESDIVCNLARAGLDNVNVKDLMDDTALMKAAENGHQAVVRLLLIHGADPNTTNPFGQTASMKAKARGHHEIAALLEQARTRKSDIPV